MTVLTRTILAAVSALVCATMAVHAQDAEFFKKSDSLYYLDIYRPYPSEMISNTTPAPKGYEPFYISHIGRHGSRWNAVAYMYERPLNIFLKAHEAGELTPLGERFHDDWLKISADAKDRYGDLSPLGAQEHRYSPPAAERRAAWSAARPSFRDAYFRWRRSSRSFRAWRRIRR